MRQVCLRPLPGMKLIEGWKGLTDQPGRPTLLSFPALHHRGLATIRPPSWTPTPAGCFAVPAVPLSCPRAAWGIQGEASASLLERQGRPDACRPRVEVALRCRRTILPDNLEVEE